MAGDRASNKLDHLPAETLDRLIRPFIKFSRIEAASGAVLLLFSLLALALVNSPWSVVFIKIWDTRISVHVGSLELARSARGWIDDGLMTLFFFVGALELKRELILGELRHFRIAALSVAGALGGMLLPACIYLLLRFGQPGANGWGTVMSTDTAFIMGCLALLGSRIPPNLRLFVLSLALIDDMGAILVAAIGYSSQLNWIALGLSAIGLTAVRGMSLLGIRSIPIYFVAGGLIWLAVDASGVHATLTGVALGLLTPTQRWVSDDRLHAILDRVVAYPSGDHWSGDTEDRKALRLAEVAARETLSPVEQLELMLHPWIGFLVLPLFAFANAGVHVSFGDLGNPITAAVFAGLVIGKPVGILAVSWIAVRTGIAVRPKHLSWGMMTGGGLLAGIGFTMALLIANLAYGADMLNAAKLGILSASVVSAAAGITFLAWLSPSKKRSIDNALGL